MILRLVDMAPKNMEDRLCKKAVAEIVLYISGWIITLIALYYFGVDDVWTLLIISAGWWGTIGAWILYTLQPSKEEKHG